MRAAMNHDEASSELEAVAFDLLDAPERDAVLDHVATCEACRAELDSLRATVADLAFAAPLAADTATGGRGRIRDRLLSRAMAANPTRSPFNTPLLFPKVPDPAA